MKVNSWEHVEQLFFYLGTSIDLEVHRPLLKELLGLLSWSIEPIYRPISPSRFFSNNKPIPQKYSYDPNCNTEQISQVKSFKDFFNQSLRIMRILKSFIG